MSEKKLRHITQVTERLGKDNLFEEKKLGKELMKITSSLRKYAKKASEHNVIDKKLYEKYNVKNGLRDMNGKGVLAGLTNVSDIQAKKIIDGKEVPCEGNLYYRGYNIKDIVEGFLKKDHFGFEEAAYLLLFGELPTVDELLDFEQILAKRRDLPKHFVRDVIMKSPSKDMMNSISRAVLMLYTYDPLANDTSLPNVLKQSLNLIAQFPRLMVYGYQAYKGIKQGDDLFFYAPRADLSTAENILYMLRQDKKYSPLEAQILDMALVLHMDHGGGNNSTFTARVVSSSGTDTYSVIAAALGSLKGPRHGGANIKVVEMFDDIKKNVKNWKSEKEIKNYLELILDKKVFDKTGLIYGMGHAVYSVSDPRAEILRDFVEKLAMEKGYEKEYKLYSLVEKLAPKVIAEKRHIYKGVNANIDFYSGLIYSMLGLPSEIYTPLFATARIVGWSAHRLEEIQNNNKITRPAFKPAIQTRKYVPINKR